MSSNRSKLAAFGAATTLLIAGSLPQVAAAQTMPPCTFQQGFAGLAQSMGGAVGSCLENEYFNPLNGNAEQHTTTGLLYWRKADGTTAFTNGYETWLNGPYGLQVRLNTERYDWEPIPSAPLPAPQPQPAPSPVPAPQPPQTVGAPNTPPEQWLEIPKPCEDLRAVNLQNADKRGFDFTCADMQQAKLGGGDFTDADFSDAKLIGATMTKTTLYNATLNRVIGDFAKLGNSNLRQAELQKARFFRADFAGADLRNADLRDADLSHSSLRGADLRCADLRGADLTGANLTGANVTGANLNNTRQDGANMQKLIGLHTPTCS
jgi:hypothetical protein